MSIEIIELAKTVFLSDIGGSIYIYLSLILFAVFLILIFIKVEKWALLILPLPLLIGLTQIGLPEWIKYLVYMGLGIFWFIMLISIFRN